MLGHGRAGETGGEDHEGGSVEVADYGSFDHALMRSVELARFDCIDIEAVGREGIRAGESV